MRCVNNDCHCVLSIFSYVRRILLFSNQCFFDVDRCSLMVIDVCVVFKHMVPLFLRVSTLSS